MVADSISVDQGVGKEFYLSSSAKLINEFGKLQFTVFDSIKSKNFTFDLSHPVYDDNHYICWSLSELFVMYVSEGKGWSNPLIQTLSGRHGTIKNKNNALKRIGVWWANNKPNTKLSEWTERDLRVLLLDVLELRVEWEKDKIKPGSKAKSEGVVSRLVIENILFVLNKSNESFCMSQIQDGLTFTFSEKQVKKTLSSILHKYGMTYDGWKRSETWPAIPLPVAMLLLNNAIEVIHDKKTEFLIEYFQQQRSEMYYSVNSIFGGDGTFKRFCDGLWRYEGTGNHSPLESKPKAEAMLSLIKKHFGEEQQYFPMTNNEITQWCTKVYQAALVIMLTLTGARNSEIVSLKAGALIKNLDGVWDFESDIVKTNYGMTTVRAVHGLAAEAVYALEELSYIDKTKQQNDVDIPLFGRFFRMSVKKRHFNLNKYPTGASEGTFREMLNQFYAEFLKRHPEIKKIMPNIHPHMFRHTFAEFALRRFDGNVHEAIRRHFRHSHGSLMTNRYLSGKEDEAFANAQERMIKDIAERMINEAHKSLTQEDFEPQFFGAAIAAAMNIMDVVVITSEEDLEGVIEEFAEGFEKIVPHEYGYCMPRTQTITQSKCFDKTSKTVKLEEAGFSTCSSCIHSVQTINSHKAAIMQIGLTHKAQMKSIEATTSFGLGNNKSYQVSKKAVREANRIVKAMNESKIIATSKEV